MVQRRRYTAGAASCARSRSFRRALACLLLATAISGAALAGKASGEPVKAGKPEWRVDLRRHGYRLVPTDPYGGGEDDDRMAFGSDSELVVLDHSVRVTEGESSGESVRAFVLDAGTGTVVRTRTWSGRGSGLKVFATVRGNYALVDNGTALLGPGLETEMARSPRWAEMISPRGGRLAARTRPIKAEVWITMDQETLAETGTLPGFYESRSSISDRSMARFVYGASQPYIEIETAGQPDVTYTKILSESAPHFVSDEALVVISKARFEIVSTAGDQLFRGAGGWDSGTHVTTSRGGSRVAITQERYSGHWQLLKYEQLTIYDLNPVAPVWTVRHKEMKGAFSGRSGFALSPSGSLLAINSMGVITLYRLPESKTE